MTWALIQFALGWALTAFCAVRVVADHIEAEPSAWKRRAALAAIIVFAPVLLFIMLVATALDGLAWTWRVVRRHP